MKTLYSTAFFILLPFFLLLFPAQSKAQVYTEYEIKAEFIFNFAKYIDYPTEMKAGQTFKIGILGDDPFGGTIDLMFRGKRLKNARIEILRSSSDVKNLKSCHVIFVCSSEKDNLEAILSFTRMRPILTIGDKLENFCNSGGIINFPTVESIPFEISLKAVSEAKLSPQTTFLKLVNSK